jgi:hypothetical protein
MTMRSSGATSRTVAVACLTAAMLLGAHVATAARSDARLIQALSKTTKEQLVKDKAPKGESKGDIIMGSSVLRNAVAQFGRPKVLLLDAICTGSWSRLPRSQSFA